ncbi:IucA/IucC family protein [uncultured Endozoicomonas sp.]|uniref:IucA/IucC family protein n=1 Tax=uncultured Endozoicomonas sp. TaxID=432652 RepID=UPI00260CEB9B|nr:IucA/IucC family protein [uncultured Endozoicomonas sp.]
MTSDSTSAEKSASRPLKNSIRMQAERLSANCFFNALLREWQGWSLHRVTKLSENTKTTSAYLDLPNLPSEVEAVISFPMAEASLVICLSHFSKSGRHQFILPLFFFNKEKKHYREVSFTEAVELIVKEDILWKSDSTSKHLFLNRVFASIDNIEATLHYRENNLVSVFNDLITFQASEQSLITGHSVHPTPKSREQFSLKDAELYMPEYGNSFKLHWFSIQDSLLIADSVHSLSFKSLTRSLAEEDTQFSQSLLNDIPSDHTLLPAHPWQAQRWLENEYIQSLLRDHRLNDFGLHGSDWCATSSVRAIHSNHASFMLKYSLSVKLTNSIRHLLPKEVIRGKEIHQVKYQSVIGSQLKKTYPDFDILTEPAHGAIKGKDGEPLSETMIVFRENPFNNQTSNQSTELLASLTQDNPAGESRLVNLMRRLAAEENLALDIIVKKWFQKYLTSVVEPLLGSQSNFGLLFGAHQQNLLLGMSSGYPEKVYFRDCQGTGYSYLARTILAGTLPNSTEKKAHHFDALLGNRLFTYYLIINSTFGVISALGAGNMIPEEELLLSLRRFLEQLRQAQPKDTSCLDYMLDSRELWSKGNFYCAYGTINENTLDDPMDVYHTMPNPIYDLKASGY